MLRKLFLAVKILVALVILAALGAAGYAGWFFYRTMPPTSGQAALPGLTSPVRVVRDEHGIPHIFADNMNDAARALGWLHAGERLFQMETQRRAGQGRLSEILGADMLKIDKFTRTLGLYRLAQSSLEAMSPDARAYIQAYTDGVNAWLDTHAERLPPEFTLLKFKPEPWKPADSVVWSKLMALQLSKNYELEILRAELSKTLSSAQMSDLFPGLAPDSPVTLDPHSAKPLPETDDTTKPQSWNDDTRHQIGLLTGLDHAASNEWVIAGSRTESGKPILANDPHLGLEIPVLWYLARIVTPDLSVEGATVPGLPVVLLGQNGHVAWGFTTTGSDVQDLFYETVDPTHPDFYLTPNGSARFRVRTESIRVKGEKDVVIEIRTTRHGPVLSDIEPELLKLSGKNKIVALAFTALGDRDRSAEAIMDLNRAHNAQDIVEAMKLDEAPPQNVVYADSDGNIGFINPGLVPIRKSGDGTMPAEGASGAQDWTGAIPYDQLPQLQNPKSGFIFNGNNAVVSAAFPQFMGVDWEEPWRAERMQQFFDSIDKHTLDTSASMQADNISLAARALLPYLLAQKPATPRDAEALAMLRDWDGTMDKNRPEPLIFDAWLYEMHQNLLIQPTGSPLGEMGPYAASVILHILSLDAEGKSHYNWCGKTSCGDVVLYSFGTALNLLALHDGPDMKKWRWGDEHFTMLRNKFWSHVPMLRDWTKRDIASSGDFYTLDRGGSFEPDPDHPFARKHGGGYRGIYDLGDPDKSRFIIATGESAHIFSRHYGDLLQLWNEGKYITLSGTHDELTGRGLPELTLEPVKR